MDFTAYITLCLILVAPSCHSAREERAATAWGEVTEADLKKDYKYLALLVYSSDKGLRTSAYCSGTITSISTVLTFCPKDPENAYAGLTSVADITNTEKTNKQERRVETVKKEDSIDLRICIVKNWDLSDHVGVLTLRIDDARTLPYNGCTVLGFGKPTVIAQKQDAVDIGATCANPARTGGVLYSIIPKGQEANYKIEGTYLGGPAVCNKVLRGINKGFQEEVSRKSPPCNVYIDIATHREWIDGQIKAAEAGESGGTGGTGGNGTSPSSGYSIHSYLNKYSNWKVLLLCLIIIKFLVY